jgi:hypothetical protein
MPNTVANPDGEEEEEEEEGAAAAALEARSVAIKSGEC